MTFKLGELFCGPGGLACGAMHAKVGNNKISHAWATDYDEDTCKTYIHNICPEKPKSVFCEDVRKFDLAKLPEFDALAFGFPCNDFSIVGEQRGFDGNFGPLYSYGVRVLEEAQPQWFLAENVGGLQSANEGRAMQTIFNAMRNAGYRIYPNLYKFEEYGVPQARHRIIIVGIRNDLPYEFQIPSTNPYANIDVSCRNAIENPPIPEDAANNERTAQSAQVVERLNHILPGQNAFNMAA